MSITITKAAAKPINPGQSSNAPESKKRRSGHAKVRTPSIPLDMPGRYGTGNVLAVTGWSASNLWKRIRDGRFPRPQRDGNRAWWPTHVVREAIGL